MIELLFRYLLKNLHIYIQQRVKVYSHQLHRLGSFQREAGLTEGLTTEAELEMLKGHFFPKR